MQTQHYRLAMQQLRLKQSIKIIDKLNRHGKVVDDSNLDFADRIINGKPRNSSEAEICRDLGFLPWYEVFDFELG